MRARTRERRRLEALLFVHFHKIEKTLALPEPPNLFGTSYLGPLLDLLDAWARAVGDFEAVVFRAACRALSEYRTRVGDRLEREFPELASRLDRQLGRYSTCLNARKEEVTRRVTAAELRAAVGGIDFERLACLRHSVRNFAPDPVPDVVIAHAVRIAQRTPSVCNRQAWRVHVYTTPEDKEMVLRTQDGNAGFGHLAARVLLISSDTRVYVTSGERHQAYVDGGMFAMSLVYALQAEGVVSCCLNLCNYFFQDVAVHRACRIPAWEIPIMMIAIGYPAPEYRVAASARLDTDSVLSWRAL
jgi:nitroreductase